MPGHIEVLGDTVSTGNGFTNIVSIRVAPTQRLAVGVIIMIAVSGYAVILWVITDAIVVEHPLQQHQ